MLFSDWVKMIKTIQSLVYRYLKFHMNLDVVVLKLSPVQWIKVYYLKIIMNHIGVDRRAKFVHVETWFWTWKWIVCDRKFHIQFCKTFILQVQESFQSREAKVKAALWGSETWLHLNYPLWEAVGNRRPVCGIEREHGWRVHVLENPCSWKSIFLRDD